MPGIDIYFNRKQKKLIIEIITLLFVCYMVGCKSKYIAVHEYIPMVKTETIIKTNKENYNAINSVWIKRVNGSLVHNEVEKKFKGNIRIVKDSVILISIYSSFGIEGLRIMLEHDSIFILNRIRNTYLAEENSRNIHPIGKLLDYSIIQDLLLVNGQGIFNVNDFGSIKTKEIYSNGDLYCLNNNSKNVKRGKDDFPFILSRACFDTKSMLLKRGFFNFIDENDEVEIFYSNYILVNEVSFIKSLEIIKKSESDSLKIKLIFDKIELNKYLPVRFNKKSKYKRVFSIKDV